MSAIAIEITREDETWPDVGLLVERAVSAAVETGRLSHLPGAELSIVLADDAQIRSINAEWRSKDKPTNVLSFPAAPAAQIARSPLLGDIILARETIALEAAEGGQSFEDHLSHLVIHGLLHLFGYDHETESEAVVMEALETRILATLGIADPYADAA